MSSVVRAAVLALVLAWVPQASGQFQLPPTPVEGSPAPSLRVPQRLTYQYGYGSESDAVYRRDRDLDKRRRDNALVAAPQINGFVIYRPADWLETTLEMILEREIAVQEEPTVILPSGEALRAPRRRSSLLVDQAFVTIKQVTAPFEFHFGRRNYEDERHWLVDTSMDIVGTTLRHGRLRVEAALGREVLADLELAPRSRQVRDRRDTFLLYADYRFESFRLAAYTIARHDRALQEGHPRLIGVRATGRPSESFSYWGDFARLGGNDEDKRKYAGYAFDTGAIYRFTEVPQQPAIILGYAFGTGDVNPNDGRNHEFRQSGLHSNEIRLAGFSKYKIYGEALDPELSNLHILTLGLGLRPAPNISVEFVYHAYRLDKLADELRDSQVTAFMNPVEALPPSKDVGRAFDVVIGFRNLFGLRRLGLDLRMGWFQPGKAFRRDEGDEENPLIRDAEKAFAVVAKLWW